MPRRSLLIGVQAYESPGLSRLRCPHADVDLMARILSDPARVGSDAAVTTLKDPGWADTQKAVLDFVDDATRDDTVIVYYSGHGMKAGRNELVLCMRDTVERSPHLENTGLEFLRLKRTLRARGLRRVLILLDCCYSGAATAKDSIQGTIDAAEEVLDNGEGFYVLASSGQTERSHESEIHSLFTRHIAEGLLSGAADTNGDGAISVYELSEYVFRKVRADSPLQTPHMSSHAASGDFLVTSVSQSPGSEMIAAPERKSSEIIAPAMAPYYSPAALSSPVARGPASGKAIKSTPAAPPPAALGRTGLALLGALKTGAVSTSEILGSMTVELVRVVVLLSVIAASLLGAGFMVLLAAEAIKSDLGIVTAQGVLGGLMVLLVTTCAAYVCGPVPRINQEIMNYALIAMLVFGGLGGLGYAVSDSAPEGQVSEPDALLILIPLGPLAALAALNLGRWVRKRSSS